MVALRMPLTFSWKLEDSTDEERRARRPLVAKALDAVTQEQGGKQQREWQSRGIRAQSHMVPTCFLAVVDGEWRRTELSPTIPGWKACIERG